MSFLMRSYMQLIRKPPTPYFIIIIRCADRRADVIAKNPVMEFILNRIDLFLESSTVGVGVTVCEYGSAGLLLFTPGILLFTCNLHNSVPPSVNA